MVVICHPAGLILFGVKIVPMVKKYGPEYYSARGENCPPRLDSIFEYLDKDNNEEYAYIWTVNNEWKAFNMNSFNDSKPESVEIPSGALAV